MKNFLVGLGLMVVGAVVFAGTDPVPPGGNVPEPGTLLLVALAAGVGLVSRRKK